MAKIKDPTDYDKAKLKDPNKLPARKKRTKPGQTVGGNLQGSFNRGNMK